MQSLFDQIQQNYQKRANKVLHPDFNFQPKTAIMDMPEVESVEQIVEKLERIAIFCAQFSTSNSSYIKDRNFINQERNSNERNLFIDEGKDMAIKRIEVSGSIGSKRVSALLDTGAKKNFIDSALAENFHKNSCQEPVIIRVANGLQETIKEYVEVELKLDSIPLTEFRVKFHVMPNCPQDCILGTDFLNNQKVIIYFMDKKITINEIEMDTFGKQSSLSFPDKLLIEKVSSAKEEFLTKIQELVEKNRQEETPIGLIKGVQHELRLTSLDPIRLKPYRIPINLIEPCKKEI